MTADAALFRFNVGHLSCLAINDGGARYPVAMFLTNLAKEQYDPWLRSRGEDPEYVALPYLCFVIDDGSARVLVDTGIGIGAPNAHLLPLLRKGGIDPESITTVMLSHGHGDHVGGAITGDGRPAFPNARYVLGRKEWEFWTHHPSLDEWRCDEAIKKMALALAERVLSCLQPQLDLVEPGDEIVRGITALAAYGHSPGQLALEIVSNEHRMLFLADAIVLPLHVEFPETIGVTDHIPGEMVETRITLLEKAAAGHFLVCASHLPFPGLGRVLSVGNRWTWQAAELADKP
jgi:glyoxylase-like metal-dependent hydrolase (beta-lactamase superfamily II)